MELDDDNQEDNIRAKEEIVKTDEIDQLFKKKKQIQKNVNTFFFFFFFFFFILI